MPKLNLVRALCQLIFKNSSPDSIFVELAGHLSKMKPTGIQQETIYNFAFGALYALAKAERAGYPKQSEQLNRSAHRAIEVSTLASEMANKKRVPKARRGEWLGGFYFNDALFRSMVTLEHLLRYYTRLNGNESLQRLVGEALSRGFNIETVIPDWAEIKDEVNRLKHKSWEFGQGPEIPYPDAVKIVRGVIAAAQWVFDNPPRPPSNVDPWLLKVLQRQIVKQCEFAILAFHHLEQSVHDIDAHNCSVHEGQIRIWASVQGLLVATGNISKLLWPPRPLIADRDKRLRESLSVSEESPLKPRYFRNHFEHFDERLEEFFLALPNDQRSFIDSNVSPGGIESLMGGVNQNRVLRHYDQVARVLMYRGDRYPLRPIIEAIQELQIKAEREADNR